MSSEVKAKAGEDEGTGQSEVEEEGEGRRGPEWLGSSRESGRVESNGARRDSEGR